MSPHWRWLIPTGVPLLVAVLGCILVVWPAWTSWRRLLEAKVDVVDERSLREARAEVDRLEQAITAHPGGSAGVVSPPAGAAQIEAIAAIRGLEVVSSSSQASAGGDLGLTSAERGRLRQIVVAGSFAQLVAFTSTLAERPQTLVARIALDRPARDGNRAQWSILIVP